MADKKISQLASGTNAQAGDLFVIARSGANYALTTAQLFNAPSATATLAALTVDTSTLFVDAANNRVGIGTTTPSSGYGLHVIGGTRVVASGGSRAGNFEGPSDTVGSGNAQLHIVSTDPAAADAGGILRFTANTTPAANFPVATIAGRHQTLAAGNYSGYLQFSTASVAGGVTERMRIDTAGNVGIGTLIPSFWSARLAVDGGALALASGNRAIFWNAAGNGLASIQGVGVDVLAFQTGSSYTERMRLDSLGNLGLGVTPGSWGSTYSVFQFGTTGSLYSAKSGSDFVSLDYNVIVTSSNNTYRQTDVASRYTQSSGKHQWFTAPSGTAGNAITFTQAMTLSAAGNLTIGGTNDSARLRVEGTTNISTGLQLFRAGNACSALWTEASGLRFGVDGSTGFTELMALTATTGNLGIGTTSALTRLHLRGTGTSNGVKLTLSNGGEIAALNDPLGVIDFYSDDVSVGASGVKGYLGVYNQFNGNWDGTLSRHATYMAFATSFDSVATERMRLDSAGNLGLGVTPSAWAGVGAVFQHPSVSISASSGGGTDTTAFTTNAIYNGTNWLYRTTAAATRYDQWAGSHRWFTAPSGTAGATVAFTMSWQINASGHLLAGTDATYDIGASGATRPRDLWVGRNAYVAGDSLVGKSSASYSSANRGLFEINGTNEAWVVLQRNATAGTSGILRQNTTGLELLNRENTALTLGTNDTERVRVKPAGQVRFVPLAAAPTTSVEDGDVYYDSGTNKLRVRAGGAWVDLH